MNALRTIFRYWLWLLLAAVVLQIAFAGYGAFDVSDKTSAGAVDEDSMDESFELHAALGTLLVLGGLLTFLLALAARVGRRRVLHALGIFVLLVVQMILGFTGQELPGVLGALHPLNAVLILGAVGALAARMWRGEPTMRTTPPPPAAA
jgi:uncharacterized membrane protein